jgi:hypothetical protein
MIDSFRDRLLRDLTELIPPDAEPPRSFAPAEPPRARGRRRLMLVTAATAAAAVGAAMLTTVLGGPTGSTPAWAIQRGQDGNVLVTVHEVDDPARLQEDLRAAGVPAVVRAGSPSCTVWSVPSQPEIADVLRDDVILADVPAEGVQPDPGSPQTKGDHFWRIDPQALKPGHVLAFLITRSEPGTAPDGRIMVESTGYHIIVAATDNPSCAPLPSIPPGPR